MPDDAQDPMVESVATAIEGWGLAAPALLLGEANRPLAFIGSQVLLMSQPLLTLFGWGERVALWTSVLGDRGAVGSLLARLERGRSAAERSS